MGTLTIRRKKEFYDFIYNYKVVIDGVEIDEISSGQTSQVEIADNKSHSIFVKQKIFSSPTINFKVENETILELGGFSYSKYFIIFCFGTILVNFLTRKTEYHSYITTFNTLIFALFFLIILVRRRKYLTITEISTE